MSRQDEFDHANFGIFAGSQGLAAFNSMELENTPEALVMKRNCETCGGYTECHAHWFELYCLQYGINPYVVGQQMRRTDLLDTNWVYDPRVKCFHPNFTHNCGGLIIFDLTPVKAENHLKTASKNGIISQGQQSIIRTISPIVRQLAGQPSGVPAQQVQRGFQQAQGAAGTPVPGYPYGPPMYPGRR